MMSMLPEMVIREQARRIRELKEENARLREALESIANYYSKSTTYADDAEHLQLVASRALEGE